MKNDTVEINGKPYRVEFSWGAITRFLEDKNLDLSAIDNLKTMKPTEIGSLIYYGFLAGADLDGETFPWEENEIMNALPIPVVTGLTKVLQRQMQAGNKITIPTKKKKLFSRKK